jgi:hypothetical protein
LVFCWILRVLLRVISGKNRTALPCPENNWG